MMKVWFEPWREPVTAAGYSDPKPKAARIIHHCVSTKVVVGRAVRMTVVDLLDGVRRVNAAVIAVLDCSFWRSTDHCVEGVEEMIHLRWSFCSETSWALH
jgi:hypothetical protein